MHRLLHILLLIFFTLPIHAQSEETARILSYLQKAMNFNKVVPQEKVYLHFDNMGYFENETLWFKAYVTRTYDGRATDLSKVLYVELLNPMGDVIKTRKYPIDSLGVSHGEMKLDTLLGSGFYEVRAYTRYMTNWGTNAVFSRVFPVFKAPKEEGDYSDLNIKSGLYKHREPNNRDKTDSLYLAAIDNGIDVRNLMTTISVQFYPEGGDLIVGKRCRVAMMVVDDNGRPYESEGFLMNERGDVLTSIETDSLGRGFFEVVPDAGKLTFQMRNLKKREKKQVQFFTLPPAKQEGCALSVDAVNEQMLAVLQCSDGICGNMLGYVLMHDGNIIHCDTIKAVPLMEIELDRKAMPEGVNQLTVFDSRGAIMAERLFFICPKPDKADSIRVSILTQKLKPCGKVEMELQTRPHANLSFSAMDANNMTNGKRGNMKTWMLLSSEVRGYIHNVDYYFESDDKKHRQDADLLLMIQGWRRYDWRLMSERYIFRKAQPIEDKFYLNGQLRVYRKRNPVAGVHLQAILYNKEGLSMIGDTKTDSVGNYAFKMPFMDGEWKMCIYTARNTKRGEKIKTYYVGIDRQFSPTPRYITPTEAEILHPLKPNAFVKRPLQEWEEEEDEFVPITKKEHVLQNVTVKAKKRYFTNDNWRYKNENWGRYGATIYYDIDQELDDILDRGEEEPTIFAFLAKKNSFFYNPQCVNLPKGAGDNDYMTAIDGRVFWNGGMTYNHHSIEWIVDNGETQNKGMTTSVNYARGDPFFPIWMNEIRAIYIKPEGVIHLYCHKTTLTSSNKGLRRTYFQGFNQASTFKTEDYNVIPPMADFRRTIWWQPDITTDAQGKAKVEFFNNSTCEEMYISVEGMTLDGKILVNE